MGENPAPALIGCQLLRRLDHLAQEAVRTVGVEPLIAPAPERLIKGGLPATQGIALDRSTLAFWVGYAGAELAPVYDRIRAHLLSSSKICVDETPAPVLDPGRGRTKTATSGRSPATTGLGGAQIRRKSCASR